MDQPKIFKSEIDSSVNFVWEVDKGQAIEARYVRRHDDYVACYLSTQTACAQACRMCHLTATGQNKGRNVGPGEILGQANKVLKHYGELGTRAKVVHYNFMARGEPLSSYYINNPVYSTKIFTELHTQAEIHNLLPRFLISTIIPKEIIEIANFPRMFPLVQPEIYYSLYSMNPEFRKRWMPKAMNAYDALDLLAEWQKHSKKIIRIHHALIKGENDSMEDVDQILAAVDYRGLRCDFSLVQYNPPDTVNAGVESKKYEVYAEKIRQTRKHKVKIINRIGTDVKASCGMFVEA